MNKKSGFLYYSVWALAAILCGVAGVFFLAKGASAGMAFVKNIVSPVAYDVTEAVSSTTLLGGVGKIERGNITSDQPIPAVGKAIRADLDSMKLWLYEDGQLVAEHPILSKGKPGSPWETPAGAYKILSKEENHFSSIGEVWMPYSMQFFGNFFIHGWPYYSDGRPVSEGYSGGCIRLDTEVARQVYEFADRKTAVQIVASGPATSGQPAAASNYYYYDRGVREPKIEADAYVVADLDTGEIIMERNKDKVMPVASVTKLMTALVSLEVVNQFQVAKVSAAAVNTFGFAGNLAIGQSLKTSDLLYPLLLESSNDAAEAIAEHYGRPRFLASMNDKAKSIGLAHTSFEDPSGLSPNNVSTANDLFKMARYIFKHKHHVLDITKVKKAEVDGQAWINHSKFISDEGYLGGKNGFTDEARHTLVATFSLPLSEFSNRNVAIVLLKSPGNQNDARNILKYLVENVYYGAKKDADARFIKKSAGAKETRLVFVGDIMTDRSVRKSVEANGGGDYGYLFAKAGKLKEADILFGNLEGPISDKGRNVGSIYSFRMDPKTAPALKNAGFDVLSVANNHAGDWAKEAFDDTLRRLAAEGVAVAGGGSDKQAASRPAIVERNGTKFGFLAFTDTGPNWLAAGAGSGILLAGDPDRIGIIERAAGEVDVLVVSYHFGEEYQPKSNARQQSLARSSVDAGAKLVIGHHPHVAQEVERYKGGLIAYSLGNFVFDQNFSKETMEGLVLDVRMRGKDIVSAEEHTAVLTKTFQPSL